MDTSTALFIFVERSLRTSGLRSVVAVVTLALAIVLVLALASLDTSAEPVLLAPLRWDLCRGGACVA